VKQTGTHRHARGVLDTSTVLLLSRVEEAGSLPAEPLITAITLAYRLPVYTCNPDDYSGIEGLEVVPVAFR
jgi:hypothetical protein